MCSNVNSDIESVPFMQYVPPLAPLPVIDGPTRKRALERLENSNNHNGAGFEPPAKRQAKGAVVSFRLVVHPSKLGKIIGKQGSQIKNLREETGAAVWIADPLTAVEERVVLISSKEDDVQLRSAAENALLQAATILFDGESNATANSGIQRYGAPNLTRLLIVGSQAGSLIGKGGATIKDIRESSGATVRILPPDQLPMCSCAFQGDRLIQISGEIPQVQKALELIGAKLRENPAKEITPANPGFILGAQQQMLLSQTASAGYEGSSGCISHQGSIPGLPSYGGVFLQTGVPGLPKVTAEMSVPSALMGGIIGRGGANITQIRTISGCAIKVFGEKDGAPERTIAFGGTPDQVSAAQSLVQAFLNAQ